MKLKIIDGTLLHPTPVLELRAPFIPNRVNADYLRNFHRPKLKRYSHGAMAHPGPHPVESLTQNIKKAAKVSNS